VDLGAGDDLLLLDALGYGRVDDLIDLGDGNDTAHSRSSPLPVLLVIADQDFFNIDVNLGAGSDTLVVEALGFDDFYARIDTGPAGDGPDTIVAVLLHFPVLGRVQRISRSFDNGLVEVDVLAAGYEQVFLLPSTNDSREIGIAASLGPRRD
jgi:hypothetical protein